MGDRALVQFHRPGAEAGDPDGYGPVVYLHWSGSRVPALLAEWREVMKTRMADITYGTARFIGVCHERIAPPLSLGVWSADHLLTKDDSHGDAGVFLVDCRTGLAEQLGGYYQPDGLREYNKGIHTEIEETRRQLAELMKEGAQ